MINAAKQKALTPSSIIHDDLICCDGDSRLARTPKQTGFARIRHRLVHPHSRVHQHRKLGFFPSFSWVAFLRLCPSDSLSAFRCAITLGCVILLGFRCAINLGCVILQGLRCAITLGCVILLGLRCAITLGCVILLGLRCAIKPRMRDPAGT